MHELLSVDNLIALITLTALEIVLGIDNIVFIAILTGRLPHAIQAKARRIGLALAMIMRIALLLGIKWVMGLTATLFTLWHHEFTGRDMILLAGGLFLIVQATRHIHERVEGSGHDEKQVARVSSFGTALAQIIAFDLIFSLDSVITAIGMAKRIEVMIAAVVIAVGVMMISADRVSGFIERHPTLKMLALAFLLLIGVMLVVEGVGQHINKGYIYFAMAFSLVVEVLNIRARRHSSPAAATAKK